MNKAKFRLTFPFAILALVFLSSCQPTFINLTSRTVRTIRIYTLQTEVDIQIAGDINSIEVIAVVGESIAMVKDPINPALWSCDYKPPQGLMKLPTIFR